MFSHQTKCGQLQCFGDFPGRRWEEAPMRNLEWLLLFPNSRPPEPPNRGPARDNGCLSESQSYVTDHLHLGRWWELYAGDKLTSWLRCLTSPSPDSYFSPQIAAVPNKLQGSPLTNEAKAGSFVSLKPTNWHSTSSLGGRELLPGQACASPSLVISVAACSHDLRGQIMLSTVHIPSCQGTVENK